MTTSKLYSITMSFRRFMAIGNKPSRALPVSEAFEDVKPTLDIVSEWRPSYLKNKNYDEIKLYKLRRKVIEICRDNG